jgi:alanine racemase
MISVSASRSSASATLTIDLAALASNYRKLARICAPAIAAAVVKADTYGLGAGPVVRALEAAGCKHFFVAQLSEALEIKPSLASGARIYVLNGLQQGAEAECAAAHVIPVINCLEQAWLWRDQARMLGTPLQAVLQVDTGMSRLGLSSQDVDALVKDTAFFTLVPPALVMSHLACADEPAGKSNAKQAIRFAALADKLPEAPRSLANSGGVFLGPEFHGDLARLGVCLYGAAPNPGLPNPMAPVVRLDARVIQIRDIEAGQGIGYGLTDVRDSARRIATIGVGYADGWPRALSNIGAAYYGGVRLPIAGRVSMDSITLDVSILDAMKLVLRPGDIVELLGPHQSLEDVAQAAGTIPYEILTNLGRRYHRTYLQDAAGLARPANRSAAS